MTNWAHICVDMQRMFADETAWHTPWMDRVAPKVRELVAPHAAETVFTRFVPPRTASDAHGCWRDYYEHWSQMTLDALDPELVDIIPPLTEFAPPARVVDKAVYSPWFEAELTEFLRENGTETVVVSGGETDVCVLATVMGAIDRGYRVIVASDAVCSSRDQTHDALLTVYAERFSRHLDVMTVDEVLDRWPKQ